MPRGILESRSDDMLAAVERGLAVPEAQLPRFPRAQRWERDPDFDDVVARLKTVRDAAAARLDLDPGVLCPRERLEAVARRRPKSVEELAEIPDLRRWQIEQLGEDFVRALRDVPSSSRQATARAATSDRRARAAQIATNRPISSRTHAGAFILERSAPPSARASPRHAGSRSWLAVYGAAVSRRRADTPRFVGAGVARGSGCQRGDRSVRHRPAGCSRVSGRVGRVGGEHGLAVASRACPLRNRRRS